jgi:hypothetical protein
VKITESLFMRVREHRGFGHGLRPGTDRDINCPSCKREDAAPGITTVTVRREEVIDLELGEDGIWAVKP